MLHLHVLEGPGGRSAAHRPMNVVHRHGQGFLQDSCGIRQSGAKGWTCIIVLYVALPATCRGVMSWNVAACRGSAHSMSRNDGRGKAHGKLYRNANPNPNSNSWTLPWHVSGSATKKPNNAHLCAKGAHIRNVRLSLCVFAYQVSSKCTVRKKLASCYRKRPPTTQGMPYRAYLVCFIALLLIWVEPQIQRVDLLVFIYLYEH